MNRFPVTHFVTDSDIDRWLADGYLGCTGTEAPRSHHLNIPARTVVTSRVARRIEQADRLLQIAAAK